MRKRCATSTSLSSPRPAAPRGKTQVKTSGVGFGCSGSTVTSLVPCHALHVPQHVAVSLSEPLNQMISSAPSTETVFAYLD